MKQVIEKDVRMYRDRSMSKEYFEWLGKYNIEFIGEKARVILVSVGRPEQRSRLNKVHKVGSAGDMNFYLLIVNGRQAYFKCKHNIY